LAPILCLKSHEGHGFPNTETGKSETTFADGWHGSKHRKESFEPQPATTTTNQPATAPMLGAVVCHMAEIT
jgi:hypothetical protein